MHTTPCKGCGKPMVWASIVKDWKRTGKRVPLDPRPMVYRLLGGFDNPEEERAMSEIHTDSPLGGSLHLELEQPLWKAGCEKCLRLYAQLQVTEAARDAAVKTKTLLTLDSPASALLIEDFKRQVTTLTAQVTALREAVRTDGRHVECHTPCDCGLDAALGLWK